MSDFPEINLMSFVNIQELLTENNSLSIKANIVLNKLINEDKISTEIEYLH